MIGGNIDLVLKQKVTTKNDIGENELSWVDYKTIHGFLDFMTEGTGRTNYNSKIVDSDYVFICAYCDNKEFDISYIDDPMNLHRHIEIFLKYIGD